MPLRAVIFDVDGVLVDTVSLHFEAWKRMFTEYGYHFDEKVYREKVDGRSRLGGLREIMVDVTEEEIFKAGELKQSYYLQMIEVGRLKPFESSVRFIKELKANKVRLAAASSSKNAPLVLDAVGVLTDFDAVVTGADITHSKPHPEIFLKAAEALDLSVTDCVVIEDALSGIQAAREGGFFCVGINRHGHPENFVEANYVVQDLAELPYDSLTRLFEDSPTESHDHK